MSLSQRSKFSFPHTGKSRNSDPPILYQNASIINRGTTDTGAGGDPQARFSETRSVPILTDIKDYYFSIVRFSMSCGKDLPLFIPLVRVGQSDINRTIYESQIEVSFDYNIPAVGVRSFSYTANGGQSAPYNSNWVQYVSESLAGSGYKDPIAPITRQEFENEYYWVFSQEHFCDLVNALWTQLIGEVQVAFQAFWTAEGGVGVAPTLSVVAPYINRDPGSGLFSIYFPRIGFGDLDTDPADPNITNISYNLWFNTPMNALFTNFQNVYAGDQTVGQSNRIIVRNRRDVNLQTDASGYEYIVMEQEQKSTDTLWSPIGSIVFTTSLIPIIPEQTGSPVVLEQGNTGNTNSSANFSPIITDISLPLSSANDYRQFIEYVPSGEYRLTSLSQSRQDLRGIDIQIFWKNRYDGLLYPVRMPVGSSVDLKIMFRRKDYEDTE